MSTKFCKDCKYSVLMQHAKYNPKYAPLFYSWNSEYACLKFAIKETDLVTGESYYSGITSCKDNRTSYVIFGSMCKPEGVYFESKI